MRITLHNHVYIDSEEKPIIPNLEFKKLVEEVKSGNYEAYEEAKERYSLIKFQRQLIEHFLCKK